nr:glycoprotein [Bourbon virus]
MNALLVILVVIAANPADQAELCNKQQQQGPFTFVDYQESPLNVSRLQIKVTKTTVQDRGKNFIIGYRAYWRSYCYNGGSLDGNTGCYNSLNPKPPTKDELKAWGQEEVCYTGPEVQDAWSGDSSICFVDWKMDNKHRAKELEKRSNNNHFAHHTCNLSWRCGVTNTHLEVRLVASGTQPQAVIVMPNGTTRAVSMVAETFWTDGEFSYLYSPKVFGTRAETKFIPCFKEHVKTRLDQGGSDYLIHDLTTEKFHCKDGDNFFEFPSSGFICLPDACYKNEKQKNNLLHPGMWNISEKLHAASVYDVNNVIHSLVYETESLRLSLAQLDHRFSVLTKLMNKMVSSLAKIDDRLIGALLEKPMASKFISPTKFMVSPCVAVLEEESNCHKDSIYRDGRWVYNNDPTKCFVLNSSQTIDLFNFRTLWLPQLVAAKVEGVVSDEDGWTFVANSKQALLDTMTYTKNGGKGTSMEDVLNYPSGWLSGKLNGLLLNGAVSWLGICAVVVLGVCLCRRVY